MKGPSQISHKTEVTHEVPYRNALLPLTSRFRFFGGGEPPLFNQQKFLVKPLQNEKEHQDPKINSNPFRHFPTFSALFPSLPKIIFNRVFDWRSSEQHEQVDMDCDGSHWVKFLWTQRSSGLADNYMRLCYPIYTA